MIAVHPYIRLSVDATNAFNGLNRASTLINVQTICPALVLILINTYRIPGFLFVNGETILSLEGTTHGDPLGMVYWSSTINKTSRFNKNPAGLVC